MVEMLADYRDANSTTTMSLVKRVVLRSRHDLFWYRPLKLQLMPLQSLLMSWDVCSFRSSQTTHISSCGKEDSLSAGGLELVYTSLAPTVLLAAGDL
jgi:hypothetical protein